MSWNTSFTSDDAQDPSRDAEMNREERLIFTAYVLIAGVIVVILGVAFAVGLTD